MKTHKVDRDSFLYG